MGLLLLTPEEHQRYVEAALRAGRQHLPRLHWQAYQRLAGAHGEAAGVHVSMEWRPTLAMGMGMWECSVHVRNQQMAGFYATSPGGGAVDAREVLQKLRDELTAALRPKRARRNDARGKLP